MGLFSKKETCAVCGAKPGAIQFADGTVCRECLQACGGVPDTAGVLFKKSSVSIVKEAVQRRRVNQQRLEMFSPTKKIGTHFEVDQNNGWWLVPSGALGGKKNSNVHSFDEIIEFELLEDGDSITKGGAGRAIAGGLVFGGVGAVVGGVTGKKKTKKVINKLQIKITLNDMNHSEEYVNLITTATKSGSSSYKIANEQAQQILSTLSNILNTEKISKSENVSVSSSSADEILKFKQLLDAGVITQEEFDYKKKELLGL